MEIELDKEGLISLVRGTCPNYHIFEDALIARAGHYVGGFHDKWEWNDLKPFTEAELYSIYYKCKESFKEENIPARTPQLPLDPNRKIIVTTMSNGSKIWMDEDSEKYWKMWEEERLRAMFYTDKDGYKSK